MLFPPFLPPSRRYFCLSCLFSQSFFSSWKLLYSRHVPENSSPEIIGLIHEVFPSSFLSCSFFSVSLGLHVLQGSLRFPPLSLRSPAHLRVTPWTACGRANSRDCFVSFLFAGLISSSTVPSYPPQWVQSTLVVVLPLAVFSNEPKRARQLLLWGSVVNFYSCCVLWVSSFNPPFHDRNHVNPLNAVESSPGPPILTRLLFGFSQLPSA